MTGYLARIKWQAWSAVALLLHATLAVQPLPAQEAAGGLQITIIEGDNAIVNVRQRVSREAIIQVEDENRKPVAGALVTLVSPGNGPSAVFSNGASNITLTTDNLGRVTVRGIRPNSVSGKYSIRITATKGTLRATAQLNMTNMAAAAAAAGGISAKVLALIIAGAAGAAVGGVLATRNGGAPAPQPTVITPGTPVVGPPR